MNKVINFLAPSDQWSPPVNSGWSANSVTLSPSPDVRHGSLKNNGGQHPKNTITKWDALDQFPTKEDNSLTKHFPPNFGRESGDFSSGFQFGSAQQGLRAITKESFAIAFRNNPDRAVDEILTKNDQRTGSGFAVATLLLPYLVRASYAQQNLILDALLRASTPEDVIQAALVFASEAVGDDILEAAAGVLENFGGRSWDALATLASTKNPHSRHFIRTLGYIPAPNLQAKIDALVALSQNPDLDTRWEAANLAEAMSPEAEKAVWKVLSSDSDIQLRITAETKIGSFGE